MASSVFVSFENVTRFFLAFGGASPLASSRFRFESMPRGIGLSIGGDADRTTSTFANSSSSKRSATDRFDDDDDAALLLLLLLLDEDVDVERLRGFKNVVDANSDDVLHAGAEDGAGFGAFFEESFGKSE